MIIYKETVSKMKVINPKIVNDARQNIRDHILNTKGSANTYIDKDKPYALASGNAFESLAKTNPEEFSKEKLEQLQNSTDIVNDFNKFFVDLLWKQAGEYDNDESDDTHRFNISIVVSLRNDMVQVAQSIKGTDEITREDTIKAFELLKQTWIPEAMTEDGCRKLIATRMKYNKLLTDSLTKMLKLNYQALQISESEAATLIAELKDDKTNHTGIRKIQDLLDDPAKLEKFKISPNSYDFRPIGGGCLFLCDDDSVRMGSHPSKNLSLIFNYDALVFSHGSDMGHTVNNTARGIYNRSSMIDFYINKLFHFVDRYEYQLVELDTYKNPKTELPGIDKVSKNIEYVQKLRDLERDEILDKVPTALDKLYYISDFFQKNEIITPQSFEEFRNYQSNFLKRYKQSMADKDPKTVLRDGKTAGWTIRPIDTLTKKNLTSVPEILRTLKAEGFKKVLLSNCNPGGYELPKYIQDDKDFDVKYSTVNIYIENEQSHGNIINEVYTTDEYRALNEMENSISDCLDRNRSIYGNYSLDELYAEYDRLENKMIITEGVGSSIKEFLKKAMNVVMEIFKRIIQFFKNLFKKIHEFFAKRFGSKKTNYKTSKPVEYHFITLSGDKAGLTKKTATSPDVIKDEVLKANQSIAAAINNRSRVEQEWFNKMNAYLDKIKNAPPAKTDNKQPNSPQTVPQQEPKKESTIYDDLRFILI